MAADEAIGGFVADDAAIGGGAADAAAGAGPHRAEDEAGGDGCAGAAGGAAGGVVEIPGIMDFAVDFVVVAAGEFEAVVLADKDAAGVVEVGYGGAVGVGDVVFEDLGAVGGADTGGVVDIFDGVGDAVEVAAAVACGDFGFGAAGGVEGAVGTEGEEGVELAVDGVDSIEAGLGEVYWGDFAGLEEVGGLGEG